MYECDCVSFKFRFTFRFKLLGDNYSASSTRQRTYAAPSALAEVRRVTVSNPSPAAWESISTASSAASMPVS